MQMSGEEIRAKGLALLRRELGRARPARFLQHFETGKGDYTREREKELGKLTMSELRQRVRRGKKRN